MTDGEARAWRVPLRRAWGLLRRYLESVRFDDGAGLPPAGRHTERVGRALSWVATLFIFVVGLWEIGAPFGAGHFSASTGVALGGENMLRWGVVAPVPAYTLEAPTPGDFYCHHPFGVFWTAALFSALFGHHFWVCRLPALLLTTLMPRLIFGAGRAAHGPLAGGLGALGYVTLPITLGYANFFALEGPTMFGMALSFYGYARFVQSERRRFAVLTVLGLGYAAACDWPGFVFDALILGGLFLRTFVLRRWLSPVSLERLATLWASAVVLVGLLGVFHLAAIVKLEHVNELLRQGEFRAAGSDLPLSAVLAQRRYWIALAFTPLAIVLGKVAVPVLLARLLIGRRELELFPLSVLATASVQYIVFKQGADIHFFWPQYFALYFAYALSALFATLEHWLGWTRRGRVSLMRPGLEPWVAFGFGLASVLAVVPDGLRALVYARKSGGRFNEKGLIIHPDFDKAAAVAYVARTLPEDAVVGVSNAFKPSYWMDWELERPVRYLGVPRLGSAGVAVFATDARFEARGAVESLTREFSVRAFGPYLFVDTTARAAPVEGYALVPRRQSALQRFFVSSVHPVYDVLSDPWWTWELRRHLRVAPNPDPPAFASDFEQRRVLHNLAVEKQDGANEARWFAELFRGVDRSVRRTYTNGVELLGARLETGSSDFLTLYFRTKSELPTDVEFKLSSVVEAAPRFSLTPKDELSWDVGMPFAIRTSLWRPGFIYSAITELTRRPGSERYDGGFRGPQAPTELEPQRKKPILHLR